VGLNLATAEPRFRERARQLAGLIVERTCDPDRGCVLEVFRPDWRYSPMAERDRVLIGHNLKVAWLLLRVHELDPHPEYVQAAIRMVEFCLRHGWDPVHGGFFHYVFRTGGLASPKKIWWPECEGLHALLALHRLTGEARYWDYFSALTHFVSQSFMDREHPEWFTSCHPDGTPLDDHKGGTYKSAYHTVQACTAVLQYLRSR
jgi:mannose/cellobiose epimerase-like protein (N-acyl-D-glucosamine 2-epimerase family)